MNLRSAVKLAKLFVTFLAFVWCLPATESKTDEPAKSEKPAADPMLGKKLGQVRDDNGVKMKLVWCPPGFVTMEQVEIAEEPVATEDEDQAAIKTRRVEKITPVKVLLTRGYWLGKYEVTQSEWKQVMKTEPWKGRDFTKEGDDFPATFVSWEDALSFCSKLTDQEQKAGRLTNDWEYTLPTEAQWERACRARTETKFSFGNDESKLGDYEWFVGNAHNAGEQYAHRVGQKKANPWGLYDMHGNVCEICRDVYTEKLPGGRDPEVKPDKKTKSSTRVIRGGGWTAGAAYCRSAYRDHISSNLDSWLDFRVVLSAVRSVQ
jgi:formylglycine-generating enzyme required for sulfatase activity